MLAQSTLESSLLRLMNQTGKLRMLSHRTMMLLLLAQNDTDHQDDYIKDLAKAVKTFEDFARPLLDPDHLNNEFAPACHFLFQNKAIDKTDLDAVEHFITQIKTLLDKAVRHYQIDTATIRETAQYVSVLLLSRINNILQAIETQMDKMHEMTALENERKNEVIGRSVDELEKSTRMVFMISLNASIEASRLGAGGDGFKQIVREIRDLSDQMGRSASRLKIELSGGDGDQDAQTLS